MDTGVRDLKVVFFKANSPDFFNVFYRILSFSAVSQSVKKICVWEVLIISHILLKKGRIGTWIQVCVT